ncbi:MAG: arylsulfatase, partial [bacterium]|nr:arylsulfatase [bacterium]
AGGKVPRDRIIDGLDVGPVIVGEPGATSPRKTLYYYNAEQLQAVRSGPWKLFVPVAKAAGHPHVARNETVQTLLFNVVEDVGSKRNVAGDQPEIVARLMELADRAREDLGDLEHPGKGRRDIGYSGNPQPLVMNGRD